MSSTIYNRTDEYTPFNCIGFREYILNHRVEHLQSANRWEVAVTFQYLSI